MNIALIGMPGSGKTTVSILLKENLLNFFLTDTDELIVKNESLSVNEIFDKKGEQYFRKLETKILKKILKNDNQIISTGGGIVLSNKNTDLLKNHSTVFYLRTSKETLFERVKNNKERPLLNTSDILKKIDILLEERTSKYEEAHYIIDTDEKTPDIIVKEILKVINGKN